MRKGEPGRMAHRTRGADALSKSPDHTMPFEFDSSGALVTTELDGKRFPVYVHPDGKKIPFDADSTLGTISRLNGEARSHREAKEAAEARLATFKDISDPLAAIKALGIVKNLEDKKLVDAGEVERVKAEVAKAMEQQYSPIKDENQTLRKQMENMLVTAAFSGSKFIAERLAGQNGAANSAIARGLFGAQLTVENGKLIGHDAQGNKLYSRTRPGELAEGDEIMELMIDGYVHKESILKGSNASGSGTPANGGNGGGGKTIKQADFAALSPKDRAARMKDGYRLTP